MEKTVKERIKEFCKHRHITIMKFEELSNLSNGYVSAIRKSIGVEKLEGILRAFPELSREWLLYGEGEMIKPQRSVVQQNVHGNNSYIGGINYGSAPAVQGEEMQGAPIIPTALSRQPNIDILEVLQHPNVNAERSTITAEGIAVDVWHRVRDTSLIPNYRTGDLLGLWAYPKGEEDPIPGKLYAVDTWSNGLIVRYLFPTDDGFRAHSPNSEEYPDFVVRGSNIIRIYRVMIMVRI